MKNTSPLDNSTAQVYQGVRQPKNFPGLPKNWISEWETFPSSDGKLQLFSVTHRQEPWQGHRTLVVFHGLGEHGGRYLHFPHYVQSEFSSVYLLDHRGHGRSEGLRGHVERYDLFAEDAVLAVHRLMDHLNKRFGKAEIHLLGHSMGGLIALRMLLKHPQLPIRSVTVSSPLLGIKVKVPVVKKTAAQFLSKVWGSFHMTSEVDPALLSHDREVQETYISDRLVHFKVTPRFFTELQCAMENTLGRASEIAYPLQVLLPMEDQIVDSEESLRFYRSLQQEDKRLCKYSGLYHEPFNEIGKEKVFEDLLSWVKAH